MSRIETQLRERFANAGVRGWLHAQPVGAASEVAVDADQPVVMASVYKLPLLVAFCRMVDDGGIDPREPVRLDPATRTPGPTGLATLLDPVTMSVRDLAAHMIAVSDNAAADALLELVGLDRVAQTLRALGLSATRITGGTADTFRTLRHDTRTEDHLAALEALADNDNPATTSAYDPLLASATTGRDMTRLLAAIWTDEAASTAQCEFARAALARQIWPHRLRAGFPYNNVRVAGKTGTLGALRHEVGIVHFPDDRPLAVAVFTHAARADPVLPRADAVIGETARLAVSHLRAGA